MSVPSGHSVNDFAAHLMGARGGPFGAKVGESDKALRVAQAALDYAAGVMQRQAIGSPYLRARERRQLESMHAKRAEEHIRAGFGIGLLGWLGLKLAGDVLYWLVKEAAKAIARWMLEPVGQAWLTVAAARQRAGIGSSGSAE